MARFLCHFPMAHASRSWFLPCDVIRMVLVLPFGTRSLESLRAFLQSGERFDDDALVNVVSVLRGMARCGQANKVWSEKLMNLGLHVG